MLGSINDLMNGLKRPVHLCGCRTHVTSDVTMIVTSDVTSHEVN